MQKKQVQGMVFAAGYGKRLLPLTKFRPKPLMEVLGVPLVHLALERVLKTGAKRVVVNGHHLADKLKADLGSNYKEMEILFETEKTILDTGGGLKNAALKHFSQNSGPIFVTNADTLIDIDVLRFLSKFESSKALVQLALKTVPNPERFGAVGSDAKGRIRTIANYVPNKTEGLKKRIFCGTHLIAGEALEKFPDKDVFHIIKDFYAPLLLKNCHFQGYEVEKAYGDLGTLQELFDANMSLLNGKLEFKTYDFFSRVKLIGEKVWAGKGVQVSDTAKLKGPLFLDDGVTVEAAASVGPNVVVGKGAVIKQKVSISQSLILSKTIVVKSHEGEIVDEKCAVKIDTKQFPKQNPHQ